MFFLNLFKRKQPVPKDRGNRLEIRINGVLVKLERCGDHLPANELSAIVPRAEVHRRYFKDGQLIAEEDIIVNSLTLVDAPRHPIADTPTSAGQ
ncbi:MAG: hypothetical protein GX949_00960 [Peptococcaceae bacterium]|jgi:hypothetical protein|nr:hypothetical protein [Peptococcaceae bacterium]